MPDDWTAYGFCQSHPGSPPGLHQLPVMISLYQYCFVLTNVGQCMSLLESLLGVFSTRTHALKNACTHLYRRIIIIGGRFRGSYGVATPLWLIFFLAKLLFLANFRSSPPWAEKVIIWLGRECCFLPPGNLQTVLSRHPLHVHSDV